MAITNLAEIAKKNNLNIDFSTLDKLDSTANFELPDNSNSIDVSQLGNTQNLSRIPQPDTATLPKFAPVVNAPTTEKTEAQIRQESVQARIDELSRSETSARDNINNYTGGYNDLQKDLTTNKDFVRDEAALESATRDLNELIDAQDTIRMEIEEKNKGKAIPSYVTRQQTTDALAKNARAVLAQRAIYDIAKGDYDSAITDINRQLDIQKDIDEQEYTNFKNQYEFIKSDLTAEETKMAEIQLEAKQAKLAATEIRNAEKMLISEITIQALREGTRGVPVHILKKVGESENVSDALQLIGPYMTEQEYTKTVSSINKSKGLTGYERLTPAAQTKITGEKAEIVDYIRQVFPENPEVAIAIAMAESGLETDIQSGAIMSSKNQGYKDGERERSYGVFQINTAVHDMTPEEAKDWKANIDYARKLYDERGGSFQPWSAFTNGSYKEHLEEFSEENSFEQESMYQPSQYGIPTTMVNSDAEREKFEKLVDSAKAEGKSVTDTVKMVQEALLGFRIEEGKEDIANNLLPYLQYKSDIDAADYQNTARLINSGNTAKAIDRVEKTLLADVDSKFVNKQQRAEEMSIKIGDIIDLFQDIDPEQLGRFDEKAVKFQRFFGKADQKTTELEAKLVALFQPYRLENLGSAITDTELEAILPLMASLKDHPEDFEVKINEFMNSMLIEINTIRNVSGLPATNTNVLSGRDSKEGLYVNDTGTNTQTTESDPLGLGI